MTYATTIPAKITPKLLAEMDELVKEGWYANRSEFVRDAIRDMLRKLKLQKLESAIKNDIQWGLYGD